MSARSERILIHPTFSFAAKNHRRGDGEARAAYADRSFVLTPPTSVDELLEFREALQLVRIVGY